MPDHRVTSRPLRGLRPSIARPAPVMLGLSAVAAVLLPIGAAIAAPPIPASSATPAVPAAPEGRMVSYEAHDEKVDAYLVRPAAPGFHAGVVVIHEWWGLNGQIKGVADRLARIGYIAIVPDLYRGKVASEPDLAHELMRGLNEDRAVALVKGAADYLRRLDHAPNRPVGTIGFCMGGRLSLAAALKGGDLQAAAMFYGSVETTKEAVAPLVCPLLGLFGRDDRGISEDDVKKFESALKEAGKSARIVVYPGAGHAFFNETRPSYDKEAAQDAWANLQDFLAENLRTGLKPGASKPSVPVPPVR